MGSKRGEEFPCFCGLRIVFSSKEYEMQMGATTQAMAALLQELECRLGRLSPERLRVVNDFLAYLEERESSEATQELLKVPGFEEAFQRALKQAE